MLPQKTPQDCGRASLYFSVEPAFSYRLDAVLCFFLLRIQLSYLPESHLENHIYLFSGSSSEGKVIDIKTNFEAKIRSKIAGRRQNEKEGPRVATKILRSKIEGVWDPGRLLFQFCRRWDPRFLNVFL